MRKTNAIIIISIIVMVVSIIILTIFQENVKINDIQNLENLRNLTTKYETTIYIDGNYLNPNIDLGKLPPIKSKLNWESSIYVYETRQIYPLKLEYIGIIIQELFKEKTKFVFEITKNDKIFNFTAKTKFKDIETPSYSRTMKEDGEIVDVMTFCEIHSTIKPCVNYYDEEPYVFKISQYGPSPPYYDWMLFLDENFSWKLKVINNKEYDDEVAYVIVPRKTETIYKVDGIEILNGRECFRVLALQYEESETILPKKKDSNLSPRYPFSIEQDQFINMTHYSIMWIDKNERILIKSIEYHPFFSPYKQETYLVKKRLK